MFKNLFKLDLRSLALTRVLLGILLFFDIWRRLDDLEVFFSDAGIMSRADVMANSEIPWRMTLLNLNGSEEFALIISLIGMMAAITFTLGWKTRLSNLILWLVTISFQARFPEGATSGGDMLIRIFLFWSLFLPMNALYSFDRAVGEDKTSDYEYGSVFTGMWIIQVFLLYFMTFFYKWAPVYHTDFEAVWYMLQLDLYITPVGRWMGQQYMLTKVLSFACYALELIGPLMLLIPWKRDMWRSIAVLSFWGFHLGIGLTMWLGNFVPICLIIWMAIIPTAWWSYLSRKTQKTSEKLITLYYDSRSNFARQLGLITKEMLFLNSVQVLPVPQKRMIHQESLFVLEDHSGTFLRGIQMVSALLQGSFLKPVRSVGRLLSSNYTLFMVEAKEAGSVNISESNEKKLYRSSFRFREVVRTIFDTIGFSKVRYRITKFEKFMGTFLLLLVIAWNIEGYVKKRDWYIGAPFDQIMFMLHLNQGWAMFAPHPQRSDGWWVMEGELKNGRKWDALNNKEVTFKRPHSFYATYKSEDWRKFLDNLNGSRDDNYLRGLGRYLCRTWNSGHKDGDLLQTFKLHYMQEWTTGPKETPRPIKKITLWNHSCY